MEPQQKLINPTWYICNVRPEDKISAPKVRSSLNWLAWENVYKVDDYNGLVIWREWKRVLVQTFRGRSRITCSEIIRRGLKTKGKSARTKLKTEMLGSHSLETIQATLTWKTNIQPMMMISKKRYKKFKKEINHKLFLLIISLYLFLFLFIIIILPLLLFFLLSSL